MKITIPQKSVGSNLHCACQRRQSRQFCRHIHRLPPLHQARELYNREEKHFKIQRLYIKEDTCNVAAIRRTQTTAYIIGLRHQMGPEGVQHLNPRVDQDFQIPRHFAPHKRFEIIFLVDRLHVRNLSFISSPEQKVNVFLCPNNSQIWQRLSLAYKTEITISSNGRPRPSTS